MMEITSSTKVIEFLAKKAQADQVSSCGNTGPIRDDPYWTSRKNSLELIKLSSINKASLGHQVSSCSNTGSIRNDPYWNSRKNILKLIKLSRKKS